MALLKLDDVTIRFGGLVALDGVSLAVEQGEILAFQGPAKELAENPEVRKAYLGGVTPGINPDRGSVSGRRSRAPFDRGGAGARMERDRSFMLQFFPRG
nr:hypothetical protein [Geobacter sp.]